MEFGAPASAMANIVKGDDGDGDDHDRDHAVLDQYYHDLLNLPPGFRFHPTDEEIVTHYLTPKVINPGFIASAIGQADLNKSEPWDLPQKAKMGEKEWFFFCQRDRKYPTGMRTNRATESGYWKATGKDKEIYNKQRGGGLVGMKKTLVFYKGRAPKGEKTNWVMHEFRLEGKFAYYNFSNASKDEWVVCRVVHKNSTTTGTNNRRPVMSNTIDYQEMKMMNSFVDGFLDSPSSLPPLVPADYHDKKFDSDKNEEVEIKGKFVREFTDGNGLNNNNNNNNNRYDTTFQMPTYNYNFNTNAYTYQGGPVIKNQYPNGFQKGSSSGGGDRTPVEDFMERFKVDQYFSSPCDNQSISYSQDTGLSTAHDMNNEISSSAMASDLKQEITSTDPLVRAPSLSDFDNFWEY